VGLAGVLGLAAFLNIWNLSQNGYGNTYYAAAVRSMMQSWHNFFFAAYDPGGFITVDKPPVALWIQTASAKLFGYSGMSLLLPEALAGVAAVFVLYLAVSRVFGRTAGLIAGLVLALTPISVAVARTNNLDAILILFVVLAAYTVVRALEHGSWRWLILSAVFMGIAFNTKFLAAYVALPALWFAYLVTAPISFRARIRNLAAATVCLAVISGAWVLAVDLTPASARPYVGGSSTNSELNLLVDYNGLGRIDGEENSVGGSGAAPSGNFALPSSVSSDVTAQLSDTNFAPPTSASSAQGQGGNSAPSTNAGGGGGGAFSGGAATPLSRLFNNELAGQASWLLPLAFIGGVAALLTVGRRLRGNIRLGSILVWGGWLLSAGVVFSEAKGIFHPYYLSFLGPALGGMVAIGMVTFWRSFRAGSRLALFAPVALLATAIVEVIILRRTPSYQPWLAPTVLASVGVCVVILVVMALRRSRNGTRVALTLAVALGALLLPPLFWSSTALANPTNGTLPSAGPQMADVGGNGGFGGSGGINTVQTNSTLIDYLEANRGDSSYLVATESSQSASSIIIATGEPVMAMGGFSGTDPAVTVEQVAQMVEDGTVRFFLLQRSGQSAATTATQASATSQETSPDGGGTGAAGGNSAVTQAVTQSCTAVDASAYGGQSSSALSSDTVDTNDSGNSRQNSVAGGTQLYDCQGAADAIRAAGGN
jgi:4-amino-4-deoxy-L-arabinose transferase-like glycosyltransferase